MLGYSTEDILARPLLDFVHPDDREATRAELRKLSGAASDGSLSVEFENRFLCRNGLVKWLQWTAAPHLPRQLIYAVARDVTDQKRHAETLSRMNAELTTVNSRLHRSLEEKEVLLREIHHRVKNNLQVISSLLDLQSQHTSDSATVEMFRESQNRVRSMALIHERLYRAQDLSRVNFAEYLEGLTDHLLQSYRVNTDAIRLDLHFAGDVQLAIDTAVPCGLLVNELVSNCLKHAFQGRDSGVIRIELRRLDGARAGIWVSDNGRGLPEGVDPETARTFGLQLVAMLVDQLRGTLTIERSAPRPGGTTFAVVFPLPRPAATWR